MWAWAIMVLTLSPKTALPQIPLWGDITFDKFAHAFVYGILVVLLIIGFKKQFTYSQLKYNAILFALAISISYGIILELLQIFAKDRFVEVADITANFIGCILGFVFFFLIYGRKFVFK
ncbi:MAG: VanZ family protein [Bacteroidetes bacterium]|nr:MAG: VanZ family protein [Bacteroidota bacterium]